MTIRPVIRVASRDRSWVRLMYLFVSAGPRVVLCWLLTHYAPKDDRKFLTFQHLLPEFWDYRCIQPCPVYVVLRPHPEPCAFQANTQPTELAP